MNVTVLPQKEITYQIRVDEYRKATCLTTDGFWHLFTTEPILKTSFTKVLRSIKERYPSPNFMVRSAMVTRIAVDK